MPIGNLQTEADLERFVKGRGVGRLEVLLRQLQGHLRWGIGTPEGAVAAPVGTLFLREDGGASTTLYVKESGTGNTGWVAK